MQRRSPSKSAALLVALGPALSLAAPAQARGAPATELLYERTLMGEADRRCALFTPSVAQALSAAAAQARGAAIRAGAGEAQADAAAARARARADGTPCDSRDLAVAAARVRAAFHDYALLTSMSFPGQFADWRAERPRATQPRGPQWRMVQFAPGLGMRPMLGLAAGLAAGPPALTAVAPLPEAQSAVTARLLMRDPAQLAQPYLDPRRRDLASRLPPRALDQVFLARARLVAPRALMPREAAAGAAFIFPPEATALLGRLDPRDAVALEIVYGAPLGAGRNVERVQTTWFEVGDFAAAEAFLAVPPPPAPVKAR